MEELITIKAFRAIDELEACINFYDNQKAALSEYGLSNVPSLNNKWFRNKNVFVIMCQLNSTRQIIGGVRFHIKSPHDLLPLEEALDTLNYKLKNNGLKHNNSGELCALWKSKDNTFKDIVSQILLKAVFSSAHLLNINTVITFAGKHTVALGLSSGFTFDEFNNLDFNYPNKNYISKILIIKNVKDVLQKKQPEHLSAFNLLNSFQCQETHIINNISITVNYDFTLLKNSVYG